MAFHWLKSLTLFSIFIAIIVTCPTTGLPSSSSSSSSSDSHLSSFCESTPHPESCFDSLKLSVSINIGPLNFLLQILETALSEAGKLSNQFSTVGHSVYERQKGTVKDCQELQQITVSSVKKSVSVINSSPAPADSKESKSNSNSNKLNDARAFLSAALTNKATCLEALDSASGPSKPVLVNSMVNAYKHVANALSVLSKPLQGEKINGRRRLMGAPPSWLSKRDRRILQSSNDDDDDDDDDQYDPSHVLTVAGDGTGNFTTLSDAINFAPNNSFERILIYVKQGVYRENVEIPSWKTNIVLLGDGSDTTVITGSRSVGDGWTTFRSATVAVSGEGFLARDIAFENTAGAEKHQAVALRVNADLAAFYRCAITGYQDSLYVHTFRQFYRECDIKGTIDYIFGNAAVVFQGCNLISRMPLPGQFTVITAQSRDNPDENTGISIQNCSILPTQDLYSNSNRINSYLGRPWKNYSRTVVIDSYIDDFIAPQGWIQWSGGNNNNTNDDDQGLNTLYYGEYNNNGGGSSTENRVSWEGYHVMDYYDASNFTVSDFIAGDEWLDSTSFPYDNDI